MPKAKYIQLKEYLRHLIEQQKLKPGEKIPSQKELTEEFGIGRLTARQAIGQLASEGYLNSQQGKGTFVTHYAWKAKNSESKGTLMLLFSEEPSASQSSFYNLHPWSSCGIKETKHTLVRV
jgi:DNA-binding GntR family transcriptional regulator